MWRPGVPYRKQRSFFSFFSLLKKVKKEKEKGGKKASGTLISSIICLSKTRVGHCIWQVVIKSYRRRHTHDPDQQIHRDSVSAVEVPRRSIGCRVCGGGTLSGTRWEVSFGIFVPQPDLGLELHPCSIISIAALKHVYANRYDPF